MDITDEDYRPLPGNATEIENRLISTGILMSIELREIIDDAVEASGDKGALQSIQTLVANWETAFMDYRAEKKRGRR